MDDYVVVKLDMSKAYDQVEWSFLKKMMMKMGFARRWVDIIITCVTTVSYRIRVNGKLTEEILPGHGLRQGDPLSPYLSLICAEGFSALLNAAEANGFLSGVKICQQATSINHLLFADDSPLLLKIDDRSSHHLQNILTLYEDCSGQTINKDKSSIMFSKNAKAAHKHQLMVGLDITIEARNDKYLGLPVYMGKSKAKTFTYLKERVWKRVYMGKSIWEGEVAFQSWKGDTDKSHSASNSYFRNVLF